MADTKLYDEQIEKIFQKLEGTKLRSFEIISQKEENRLQTRVLSACIGLSTLAIGVAMICKIKPVAGLPIALGLSGAACLVSAVAITEAINISKIKFSRLLGKSTPLNKDDTTEVNRWAEKHPRLLPLLARWSAQNPQKQLSSANVAVIEKDINRLDELVELRKTILKNDETLAECGLSQAVKKCRLSEVAGLEDLDQAQTKSGCKPAM